MRIAVDARMWRHSGAGRYVSELYARLPLRLPDHEWTLVVGPGEAGLRPAAPNVRLHVLPQEVPIYTLREQWTLPRAFRSVGADLVHVPHFNVPLLSRTPRLVTVYDLIYLLFPGSCPSGAARLYARLFLRLAVRTARHVLTLSERSRRDLVTHLGADPDRITVTPAGGPPAADPPAPAAVAATLARMGLDGRPYALYVGLQLPHKNLLRLVRAFDRVRTRHPELLLVLAGRRDPRRAELWREIEERGLSERVRVTGFVPEADLPALYAGARLFVTPSLYEGFGLPPLEAMAAGVPVAAASSGSLLEVLGDAALWFDPVDEDAMAEAIGRVHGDEALRGSLREKGAVRVRAFSWETCADRTADVFRKAVLP